MANGTDHHQEISTDRFNLRRRSRVSQSGAVASERKFYGNSLDDVRRFNSYFFELMLERLRTLIPSSEFFWSCLLKLWKHHDA